MSAQLPNDEASSPLPYDESIALGGFRLTRQRREVYEALMETRDHPSAVQVFTRVQKKMPTISLATVYNCLETLTQCGLVRQVNLDRGPSRFCANLHRHGHFFCTQCGRVHDVDLPDPAALARIWSLPPDYVVNQYEFSLRGLCRECSTAAEPGDARVLDSHEP
jgi:Fe2+ or Zn2+ uptake regulation protein